MVYTGQEIVKGLTIDARVHRVLEVQVDDNATKKEEGLRINKPFKLFTTDSIVVNEVKKIKVSEGIDSIVVNGGKSPKGAPLSFQPKSKFPGQATEVSIANGTSVWTDNYELAHNTCTLGNNAELTRIEALIDDLLAQKDTIKNAQEANERAFKTHQELAILR